MTTDKSLISIGVITAPHGVRGQVKIKHFLDNPKSVLSNARVVGADGHTLYKLTLHGMSGDMLIAAIDGVDDRNAAERLKRTELFIEASALPAANDGSWYYHELIGLKAIVGGGALYGEIVSVQNYGAGDVVEIRKTDGTLEMLPFNDAFTGKVSVAEGYMVVMPPDYVEPEPRDA